MQFGEYTFENVINSNSGMSYDRLLILILYVFPIFCRMGEWVIYT